MPTEKYLTNFVINKVPTKSIFNKMKTQGLINDDEIYLVEEDDQVDYLPLSGGIMAGSITTKGIVLTSGTDYGSSLPSSPKSGQLFFQTTGSKFVLDNVYPVGAVYISINSTSPKPFLEELGSRFKANSYLAQVPLIRREVLAAVRTQ